MGLRLAWIFWGFGVGVHDGLHQGVMKGMVIGSFSYVKRYSDYPRIFTLESLPR